MKQKLKYWLKENYCLLILLVIGLIISLLALNSLGFKYTINSDDISYINSGIKLYEKGIITMHGPVSAQIMPGLTILISSLCFIFGTGNLLIISLKILYIIMFLTTLIYSYKTINLFTNKFIASICSLFLLTPDFIWTNNLILTETPYILFQSMLLYYSLKLGNNHNSKIAYIMIIISYICALFIRPTIALYPIFLFIYLILKKYDLKKLLKQVIIALIILILFLTPWIIRNYKVFNKFIPLTYGAGNPLLLGTYQGYNYPLDEELYYKLNVDDKLDKKMSYYLENYDKDNKWSKYYSLEYDEIKAKYRMKEWWKKDKISMLKSYLIFKPKILLGTTFYWDTLFNVPEHLLELFHKIMFIILLISSLIIIFTKRYFKELVLLLSFYIYNIFIYSYTFAYGRYALTLYAIRYIVIGLSVISLILYVKERKLK